MDIKIIEEELKTGQVSPPRLAEMRDWLAGSCSSMMDRQLELQVLYADYFNFFRSDNKSDKSTSLKWEVKAEGKEQLQLETTQKKIKVLLQAISSHLRVHENMARNIY